jgi:hypothetical protein
MSGFVPYGYGTTPPVYTAGSPASPFDIVGITQAIERAASSIPADKHGNIALRIDQDGAGLGIVVKGPFSTEFLGTVTKPRAGSLGWSVSGRVNFAVSPPKDVLWFSSLRGSYRMFRLLGSGRFEALVKALSLEGGEEVWIVG